MDLIATIDRWGTEFADRPAHISAGHVLTYAQLRQRSDRLASFLAHGLPADRMPVAILGHKQPEMLIGFLACLKSGHPYIPLDSSLPAQRVTKIVQTSHAAIFAASELTEILNDAPEYEPIAPVALGPEDLWYIIFTSGSTGDPKGVMITRGCLESFLTWVIAEHRFSLGSETFLNQAPFSFDLSVMDLYASLATAGTLFSITQEEVAEPRRLFDALGRSGVSTWVSTPSFARMCLMQPTFTASMLPAVTRFWFCGETLAPEVAAALIRRFPYAEVWNTYGPTEATVATTSLRITDEVLSRHNPLPVGRPKPGTQVLIQNARGEAVADSQRGEIVIAGPNVALGYLNRPDLTERSFTRAGRQRAYRTGDAGHFADGLLFFEGRMDFQIKLHGYRIELGDIEANLLRLADVQDAVVIPAMREDRAEYLVAFAILKSDEGGSEFELSQRLRRELGQHVPDYMVPRKFVFLSEFPTTPNGKVDRQKLAQSLS